MSEPAREQREALLDDVYKRLVVDLAKDRQKHPTTIDGIIDQGPFLSSEAMKAD
jgi:hypothetical protein